jgi:hypothetical protein
MSADTRPDRGNGEKRASGQPQFERPSRSTPGKIAGLTSKFVNEVVQRRMRAYAAGFGPVPVEDENGNPIRNAQGKLVTEPGMAVHISEGRLYAGQSFGDKIPEIDDPIG